jgi:heme-degrading monooxygenase HmoA
MIRHVVLWRLRPGGIEAFTAIRAALQAQLGRIPGLLRVEVGRDDSGSRRAVDMALDSDFESSAALQAYHRHPAHMETRAIVDPHVADHWIADYEL